MITVCLHRLGIRTRLLCLALGLALTGSAGCGAAETTATNRDASAPMAAATNAAGGTENVPAAAAEAAKVDVCSLVTAEEAAAIIGELKEKPKAGEGLGDEKTCTYDNLQGAYVVLRLSSADRWDWKKGETETFNPKPIPGLGDEAFWCMRGGGNIHIYIRKGKHLLEVHSTVGLEKGQQMAAKAVGRL